MARDKIQLDNSGRRQLTTAGAVVLGDSGDNCCCSPGKVCFTKFTITWDCTTSTWSSWTNAGNFCLDPATTSTARTFVNFTGGTTAHFQQYVQAAGPVSCTADGDCSGHTATTPSVPADTDTPLDAPCNVCGCTHALPRHMDVTIAGVTMCTTCFASAGGSAKVVTGTVNGTFRIDRISGQCGWAKTFTGGGVPELCRDCFSLVCTNCGDGVHCVGNLDSPLCSIDVRVTRSAANTWRITVQTVGGATFYFDSGNFTWNDQNLCDGTGSGAQANTTAGCVLPSGCAPSSAASGGTAAAIIV